jgi:pimeloyl-ACP methyl ester carboxylesterase
MMGWWRRLRGAWVEREVVCASAAGLHHMAYVEWGNPRADEVVVCAHGLTRNGRDFDELARSLSSRYRVVCPDVVGRGRSDWLADPSHYGFPQYVADMVTLIARLDVTHVHWVGTSMGGLIGMFLASMDGNPIKSLVLNDVGPVIEGKALARIGEYVGERLVFADIAEAEAHIRKVAAPFGVLTDAQWRHLTQHSIRRRDDDSWEMRYDPQIGKVFRMLPPTQNIELWNIFDRIACPLLVTRGAESDLITHETAATMVARHGVDAELVEFAGIGHAPVFMNREQIGVVRRFIDRAAR